MINTKPKGSMTDQEKLEVLEGLINGKRIQKSVFKTMSWIPKYGGKRFDCMTWKDIEPDQVLEAIQSLSPSPGAIPVTKLRVRPEPRQTFVMWDSEGKPRVLAEDEYGLIENQSATLVNEDVNGIVEGSLREITN